MGIPEDAVWKTQLHPEATVHVEVPHGDVTERDAVGVAVGQKGQELEEHKLGLCVRVQQDGRAVRDHVKQSEACVGVHEIEGSLTLQDHFGLEEVCVAGGVGGTLGVLLAVSSGGGGAAGPQLFNAHAVETLHNVMDDHGLKEGKGMVTT